MRNAKVLVAGIIAVVLVAGACGNEEGSPAGDLTRAPDFALEDLNGRTLRLKDLAGKIVMLNFFATWCPPCRQEIPDFIASYGKFKEKGLEIVGIGLDMEGAAALKPFVDRYRINYPVVIGTRKVVVDYGGVNSVPTTFFIDRKGMLRKRVIGLLSARELEGILETLP